MDGTSPDRTQDGPIPTGSRPAWLPDSPCARLIADRDWSSTPLGPLASWPLSLRTLLGTLLRAPAPMTLLWGEQGVAFYNDACAAIIGAPHPQALGRPIFEPFPELSELNAQVLRTCLAGEVLSLHETAMTLDRGRGPEPAWFDIDYLPVYGDDGQPAGALATITEITDRVAARRRIEEDEAQLRALADNLPGALVYQLETSRDLSDRRYTYVSAKVEAVLGIPESESLGDPRLWLSRVCPEDLARLDEAERVAARDLSVLDVEVRSRHPDGRIIAGRVVSRPRELPDGRLVWDGMYLDVTEARAARDELARLNALLEERVAKALAERKLWADVIEATDAFISVVGPDLRIRAINEASIREAQRLGERPPKVGDHVGEANSPEIAAAAMDLWTRVLDGQSFATTMEFGDASAQRRTYDMRFEPLRDMAGRVVAAFQIGTDVTERLRDQARAEAAEAAQREADALYRAFFENSAEALFVIGVGPDDAFVVEEINPVHQASLGYRIEDVRGKRIEEVLPPDLATQVLAKYRRVVQSGEIEQWRDVYELGGEVQHWDSSLVPIRGPEGRIVRLIGSSRNVTRQVVAEEALRQSQKLESMGSLTGGVAHDFNNLLTPIIGSLDMLQRRGVGDERMRRLIDGALQSAERAKVLVQRLLAFARRQPLQPVAVDLSPLVDGMADLMASTVGPRIRIEATVEPGLPPVQADSNQLEMAILNLAVNARDAMPEGGTLRIEAASGTAVPASLPPGGRFARLTVADTGHGMDEATLSRAVEPFFSTKGVGRGTGLGLSMVHGLASQLGGALELRSRPGEGTAVTLWLPLSDEAVAGADGPADPAPARSAGTVLLVDDEELVRTSTAQMLAELGYEVTEATSAEEALRQLEDGLSPDLVVTDHLMPGMTGTELARRLRLRPAAPPILLISGYAEDRGVPDDLPRLTKPFRQAELAAALAGLGGGPPG